LLVPTRHTLVTPQITPRMSALSLYDELEELTCPLTGNKYIGNLGAISEVVTWPAVKTLLPSSLARQWLPYWDHSLENKIPGARKVIAILVRVGKSKTIETLLLEGLADADLPLSQNGVSLQSHSREKTFMSFTTWEQGEVARFLEKQWMVLEPALRLDAAAAINLQLDNLCALSLAFSDCVEVTKDKDSRAHVYRSTVRPGFHGFDDNENVEDPGTVYVAVKKFERLRTDDFIKEREMLNTIRKRGIKNNHLIRHLAICEEVPCIIFPWADGGDLGDYWQRECPKVADEFLWSLRQMVGLTDALKDLHKENCRHGDLKPANILYFTENGVGILKIADVGVSRAHNQATALRKGLTTTSVSTKVYEGPEVKSNTPRSRQYDCWSMGCIILEFVLWLLYDFKAIESFFSVRHSEWHGYYRLVTDAPNLKPLDNTEVHPVVYEAMNVLREDPRCVGTALEALVNVVDEDLLKIKPGDRLKAVGLHQQLQKILKDAEKNHSYLVKTDALPPPIPPIFNQPPLSLGSNQDSTFQQTST